MSLFQWKSRIKVAKGRVFKLMMDAEDEGVRVSKYDLGGVDYGGLMDGLPGLLLPEGFRLDLDLTQPRTDVIGSPLPVWLVTKRVADVLRSVVSPEDVEVREAPAFDDRTGEALKGFYLMNPVVKVECLDPERTVFVKNRRGKIVAVTEPVLREAVKKHIFRAAECPRTVFVSAVLRERWISEGVIGFSYQDCGILLS